MMVFVILGVLLLGFAVGFVFGAAFGVKSEQENYIDIENWHRRQERNAGP